MTDLASLSDADLQALYGKTQGPAPSDLSHLSDDQLKSLYQQATPANRFDQMFRANGQDLPTAGQAPPAAAEEPAAPSQSWGNVAASAVGNIVPSGKRFVGDIAQAVSHPGDTLGGLWNVAQGVGEKGVRAVTGDETPGDHEQYANAVGQMISDRYGSIDKLKETIATDPVGFASDLSTILTGGSLAAARVPIIGSKVGKVAGTVARAVDPINTAVNATGAVAKGVGKGVAALMGVTTGVGSAPIEAAARAGMAGGEASRAFTENMRSAAPMEEVVADAKAALQNVKDQRQAAYQANMATIGKDSTILDFGKIDNAWNSAKTIGTFEGPSSGIRVSLSPSTEKTALAVDDVLNQWRNLPPEDFHTPLGLDALKQRLGDIVDSAERGSAAQKVATKAYNLVKNQITEQAPSYARTMAKYQQASDLVREMERALSLNRNASVDTQLRKLQSVMRDNVSTNYGQRAKLVGMLQQSGATNIMQKLAGQSLSAIAPRGVARMAAGVADLGALGAVILNPTAWPAALGALLVQSPRIVGEAAHLAGKGARLASAGKTTAVRAVQGAFQAGRGEAG